MIERALWNHPRRPCLSRKFITINRTRSDEQPAACSAASIACTKFCTTCLPRSRFAWTATAAVKESSSSGRRWKTRCNNFASRWHGWKGSLGRNDECPRREWICGRPRSLLNALLLCCSPRIRGFFSCIAFVKEEGATCHFLGNLNQDSNREWWIELDSWWYMKLRIGNEKQNRAVNFHDWILYFWIS